MRPPAARFKPRNTQRGGRALHLSECGPHLLFSRLGRGALNLSGLVRCGPIICGSGALNLPGLVRPSQNHLTPPRRLAPPPRGQCPAPPLSKSHPYPQSPHQTIKGKGKDTSSAIPPKHTIQHKKGVIRIISGAGGAGKGPAPLAGSGLALPSFQLLLLLLLLLLLPAGRARHKRQPRAGRTTRLPSRVRQGQNEAKSK